MSVSILGIIMNYRRSKVRQYNNQVLIKVLTPVSNLGALVGTRVIAKDKYGNSYKGKIIKVHSWRNQIVRAIFNPNIPGQILGETVVIIPKKLTEPS